MHNLLAFCMRKRAALWQTTSQASHNNVRFLSLHFLLQFNNIRFVLQAAYPLDFGTTHRPLHRRLTRMFWRGREEEMIRPELSLLQNVWRFATRLASIQLLWVTSDLLVATGAFFLAAYVRFTGDLQEAELFVGAIAPRALLLASAVGIGFMATGMYRSRLRVRSTQVMSRTAVAISIGGLVNIFVYYLFPPIVTGRGVLLLAMLFAFILICFIRYAFSPFLEQYARKLRVVVFGAGLSAQKIARRRRSSDRRHYEVLAYLKTSGDRPVDDGVELLPYIENIEEVYDLDVDEVVLALDDRRGAVSANHLFDLQSRGARITKLVDFLEREVGQVDTDIADSSWFVFTRGSYTRPVYLAFKRVFDLIGGITLLILLAPLLSIVCLALFIEGRGKAPIFYRQSRVGLQGKTFELLKFRSMLPDAESNGPKWATEGDQRITRVGRIIRRLRLDELPQLLNILKGDMSIVGPRPERPEFVAFLSQHVPMYQYRHLMKPGLAGWAQLSFPYGASTDDARQKHKYDLYYIKNASFVLDFFILAHTVEVVIWGESASMSGHASDTDLGPSTARLINWQPRGKAQVREIELTASNRLIRTGDGDLR